MKLLSRRTGSAAMVASALGILGTWSAPTASAAPLTTTHIKVIGAGPTCSSGFCYKPMFARVVHGNVAMWQNANPAPHTVTRCTPAVCVGHGPGTGTQAGFGGNLTAGTGTYSFTFTGLGTYNYYCAIHGYATMHGTVKVT